MSRLPVYTLELYVNDLLRCAVLKLGNRHQRPHWDLY